MESSCLREICAAVLSAMVLNEWARPRARSLGLDLRNYHLDILFGGLGLAEVVSVEGEVAGPVGAGRGGLLLGGEVAGEQGAGEERAGGLEELSFVHEAVSIRLDLQARTIYRGLRCGMQGVVRARERGGGRLQSK